MKGKIRRPALLASALLSATFVAGAPAGPAVFGEGVTIGETVSVADLLVTPDLYVDQRVQVEGVVTAVSADGGRWIELSDESGSRTVRFRSKDPELVFPPEIKGRRAVVEGVFLKIRLTEQEAIARARERARKGGEQFDPSTAVAPRTVFLLEGTGAVVR